MPETQNQNAALGQFILKPSIEAAKEFYDNDVTPRAKRERNLLQLRAYGVPQWHSNVPIYLGSVNGKHSFEWEYPGVNAYHSRQTNSIHLDPLSFTSKPSNLVHEMGHADQFRLHESALKSTFKYGFLAPFVQLAFSNKDAIGAHIPIAEQKILDSAYQPGDDANEDSKLTIEKHSSNREWRFNVWNELRQKLGRIPTLEETDAYIQSLTKEDLIRLSTNGYQEDYINNNEFDPDKVKNAMIHVAYNAPSQNTHTYYAKHGGTLNRINYFDYFN